MAADRAFRLAGRARGVHQGPGVRGPHVDIGLAVARCCKQLLVSAVSGRTGRGAEVDEIARRDRKVGARALDRLQEIILNNERRRPAVLHDVADFLSRQTEVDRHCDEPGLCGRGIDFKPLDAIIGERRNAVAFGEAQSKQRIGEPARARIPFAEGHGAVKVAGPDLVGQNAGIKAQDFAHVRQVIHCNDLFYRSGGHAL